LADKVATVQKKQADTAKTKADVLKTLSDIGKNQAATRKAHAEATDTAADTLLKFAMPPPQPYGPAEQSLMGSDAGQAPANSF
jgi:hypothetical protein